MNIDILLCCWFYVTESFLLLPVCICVLTCVGVAVSVSKLFRLQTEKTPLFCQLDNSVDDHEDDYDELFSKQPLH